MRSATDGLSNEGRQSIPMFCDLSILVHADDVEGHHLIGAKRCSIAPDVVHEDKVPVFKHADVLGGRAGLCQHRQKPDERLKPGRNEGVVLDVIRVRHVAHCIDVPLQDGAKKRADDRLFGRVVIGKGTGGKQSGRGSNSKSLFHLGGPFRVEVKCWWKVYGQARQASAPPSTLSSCISFSSAS